MASLRYLFRASIKFLAVASFSLSCAHASDKVTFNLRDVRLVDLATVLFVEDGKQSYVFDSEFLNEQKAVSFHLSEVTRSTARQVFESVLLDHGYAVRKVSGVVYIVKHDSEAAKLHAAESAKEMFFYRPLYRSVAYLNSIISPMFSQSFRSAIGPGAATSPVGQQQAGFQPAILSNGDATKDVFLFVGSPAEVSRVRQMVAELDRQAPEVLIKALVYEVGHSSDVSSALKLALQVGRFSLSAGAAISSAGASIKIGGGGLDMIAAALDADSRFRSKSRPHVRVTSGNEARFEVGSEVPVLGNVNQDNNGNSFQSVEYRNSGVILTVTPTVLDGVVDLKLNQEMSNFAPTTNGVNASPTLFKRAVQSRLSIRPGEVVAVAGLEDDQSTKQENHLPFFRFPLGSSAADKKSELLVFIEAVRL